MLRPLVSLMIRAGISFPDFVDLARALYVKTAEADFSIPGRPMTDSRISLITGVHRKEVRRLRDTPVETEKISPELSLTGRLLTRWLGSPAFTDADGHPLPLLRTASSDAPSFGALVALETKDVHFRSILDEWTSRGFVSTADDGRVVLKLAALTPEPGAAEQLHFFGRNLHDHMAAAAANVIGPRPVHLERSVHYDNLSEQSAEALAAASRTFAMQALNAGNREAQAERAKGERGRWRWNFGVYVYVEQQSDTAEPNGPGSGE